MNKGNKYCFISKSNEYSTDRILDWFFYNNIGVSRYNTESIEELKLSLKNENDNVKILFRKFKYFNSNQFPQKFTNFLSKELSGFWFELLNKYKKQIVFGNFNCEEPQRIETIENAQKCGLLTPKYLITTNKAELESFIDKHPKVICKSILSPQNFFLNELEYSFRTSEIIVSDISNLEDEFFPTYFQEKIKRDLEVRIFYLNKKCWAMAFVIKKENDVSADIGDISKRREVPIKIPIEINNKVIEFMKRSGYNTGSIDFVVSGSKWFFLELNPSGQYDFVSKRCNYFLDKEIFKFATNER